MLQSARIVRSECLLTNVFDFKLPGNDISHICGKRKEMPPGYSEPAVERDKYVRPEYLQCLDRLATEIDLIKPNIIVPMGNTALWAVCRVFPQITLFRGRIMEGRPDLFPGYKVIPTFHPAHILRNWSSRGTVVADLIKIRAESDSPEITLPPREVWINPTLEDLESFSAAYMHGDGLLSVDIETTRGGGGQIKCIGFAPRKDRAIVVPFLDDTKDGFSYWPDEEQELAAWEWCRKHIEGPCKILGQYFFYDAYWLFMRARISSMNYTEDLLLKHHALQPEMEKRLAFLGSIYTRESAWKLMRPRGTKTEQKPEEE
jgi:uracil-DNA glycosylase